MHEERLIEEKMIQWTREFDPEKIERIDKALVHKVKAENNFLSRIEQIETADDDCFLVQLAIDKTHPYYFEHDYDHVPGLMMIEGGRQAGTAIAHMYYQVPFDTVFILNTMGIRFYRYVELNQPLFIKTFVRNKMMRKDRLIQMEQDGYFIQGGHEVGHMDGTWQMYDKRTVARLRRSAQQPNVTLE